MPPSTQCRLESGGEEMRVASKRFGIVTAGAVVLTILFATAAQYGGSSTARAPYKIATAADRVALGDSPEDYDKRFILAGVVDLAPNLPGRKLSFTADMPQGDYGIPIRQFPGGCTSVFFFPLAIWSFFGVSPSGAGFPVLPARAHRGRDVSPRFRQSWWPRRDCRGRKVLLAKFYEVEIQGAACTLKSRLFGVLCGPDDSWTATKGGSHV